MGTYCYARISWGYFDTTCRVNGRFLGNGRLRPAILVYRHPHHLQ
ncbi:MAG: hypothetical protein M5U34_28650 [Chloroflexi bacterium]|nr:hypothetical protein [Chloroflexota bacterium]